MRVWIGGVLIILLASAAAARPRHTVQVPCPDGGFGLETPLPGNGGVGNVLSGFRLLAGQLEPFSGCGKTPGKLRSAGGKWRGRLQRCYRARGGYELRLTVDADCGAVRGTLRRRGGRGAPMPFVATRSRCGDGRFDAISNETCDAGQGCLDGLTCSASCTCEVIPPPTTTTTSTLIGTTTTTVPATWEPVCGNGIREINEACDGADVGASTCPNGGLLTCTSDCRGLEITGCWMCGNGRREGNEECDGGERGGALCDGPGETSGEVSCTWECRLDHSTCRGCGNGRLDPGEECDDGNTTEKDGCSPTCTRECGDGLVERGELCDDGNRMDGDGCSDTCSGEIGYSGGGGEAFDECPVSWYFTAPVSKGQDGGVVTCQDGGSPCDHDDTPGQCTFVTWSCLNSLSFAAFPRCFPEDVVRVEVLDQTTLNVAPVLDAYQDALMRIGGATEVQRSAMAIEPSAPVTRNHLCAALTASVPAGERRTLAVAVLDGAGNVDVDTLDFDCVAQTPSPP